ncbi:N-terminal acetyltransferase A complex subunit nat1 [Bienertia sinuspersici]
MRKSFGGSSSGGGNNGGELLRRVIRTRLNTLQDIDSLPSNNYTSSHKSSSSKATTNTRNTTSKHALSLSSNTPYSNNNNNSGVSFPVSVAWPSSPTYFASSNNEGVGVNEGEWECLENYYDPVFGVVPSTHEVQDALFSLHQVFEPHSSSASSIKDIPCEEDKDMDDQTTSDAGSALQRASSKGSDSDWLEPSMHPYDLTVTQSPGWGRVHDAFHLLQNEPTVQRMVISLSSDKAVWDAVLNNDAVREIRDSYRDAAESLPPSSDEELDPSKGDSSILKWIFENMKMKLFQVLGNISQIVGDTFKPHDRDKEEQSNAFVEKLKSTFLLTIVVLLIVVVARGHKA